MRAFGDPSSYLVASRRRCSMDGSWQSVGVTHEIDERLNLLDYRYVRFE
jgi:hypothetical protein